MLYVTATPESSCKMRLPRTSEHLFLVGATIMVILPHLDRVSGKGTRFRTKMQVGPQPLGRNKPYAQVMVPHTGKFRSEDGERYYRHSKGARISKASHFDFDYELGHKIKFLCVAKGSPRPSITWFKDGMEVYQHGYMHISEHNKGKRRLKSKMEIDPATQGDAGVYECHANNKWSMDMRSFRTDYVIEFEKK